MAKLPISRAKSNAFLAAVATVVGPQVVEMLKDPARAEQLKGIVTGLSPAMRARTADGRLAAKIAALRAHVDAAQPGDVAYAKRETWLPRLAALDAKRSVIGAAYTGRDRRRHLKTVSGQVDDLLIEFLHLSDDAITGRGARDGSATSPPAD